MEGEGLLPLEGEEEGDELEDEEDGDEDQDVVSEGGDESGSGAEHEEEGEELESGGEVGEKPGSSDDEEEEEEEEVVGSRGGEAGTSGRGADKDGQANGATGKKRKQTADPESMQSLKKQLEDARKKRLKQAAEQGGGTDEGAALGTTGTSQSTLVGARHPAAFCLPCVCNRGPPNLSALKVLTSSGFALTRDSVLMLYVCLMAVVANIVISVRENGSCVVSG